MPLTIIVHHRTGSAADIAATVVVDPLLRRHEGGWERAGARR